MFEYLVLLSLYAIAQEKNALSEITQRISANP